MKKQDYIGYINKTSTKKLEEKLEELRLTLMKTYTFTEHIKGFKESRGKLRKEMARIKTELRKRREP